MQELKAKEILETLDKLEEHSDRLYELLPETILLEMNTAVAIDLSTLRGLSLDIDHALIINSGVILKLRGMADYQEAKHGQTFEEMEEVRLRETGANLIKENDHTYPKD